jgi:ABC-2 type transport system ATP-binding protein
VAGFDVQEHPMEVKRRIGYLPETPPLYPDMEVREYLHFVGQLKGIPKADLARRVAEVSERCSVADVSSKLIAKLSKGYKQRVGLAQAIIHNPDVLILDEPTSGLDPKQRVETLELIKSLKGDHTIILSTHVLSEIEATCQDVIIISKGKVVATDTMDNLTHRLKGSEAVAIEVEGRNGAELATADVQRKLEQVSGVSRVINKAEGARLRFEVESLQGRVVRAEVARAVVESGWNLTELAPVSVSLEEVFLQLTESKK